MSAAGYGVPTRGFKGVGGSEYAGIISNGRFPSVSIPLWKRVSQTPCLTDLRRRKRFRGPITKV